MGTIVVKARGNQPGLDAVKDLAHGLIGWPLCTTEGKAWEAGLRVGATGRHQHRIIVTGTKTHEAWANPRTPARCRGDAFLAGSGLSRVGGNRRCRMALERACLPRRTSRSGVLSTVTLGTRARLFSRGGQPPTPTHKRVGFRPARHLVDEEAPPNKPERF